MLTDLESTNGTRVNGEDAQLRILRFGDVISLGRSVLLYGTREQIAGRLDALRDDGLNMTGELDPSKLVQEADSSLDFEVRWGESENLHSTLHIPDAAGVAGRAEPRPGGAAFGDASSICICRAARWCSRSRCPKARRR